MTESLIKRSIAPIPVSAKRANRANRAKREISCPAPFFKRVILCIVNIYQHLTDFWFECLLPSIPEKLAFKSRSSVGAIEFLGCMKDSAARIAVDWKVVPLLLSQANVVFHKMDTALADRDGVNFGPYVQ